MGSGDIDLDGPDDVQLEPVDDGLGPSSAAALLHRLRTSSSGERRPRRAAISQRSGAGEEPGASSAAGAPGEEPPGAPGEEPPGAPAVDPDDEPTPEVAPSRYAKPQPSLVVEHGGRTVQVPVGEGERAATVALRAAVELGIVPVDPSGRLIGIHQLVQRDQAVPGGTPAATLGGAPLRLRLARAEIRIVTLEVHTDPPTRLRTPMLLSAPSSWLIAGLVDWLLLPVGAWTMRVGDDPVPADLPLREVIGDATEISLVPSGILNVG